MNIKYLKRHCILYDLSFGKLTSFENAWRWQRALVEFLNNNRKINEDAPEYMLIVQHRSVYSLGKGAEVKNIKIPVSQMKTHDVFRIERGGDITWHGKGQLVVYPILDLNRHKKDLHWYVYSLEKVVIEALSHYDIQAERSDVNRGVWIGNNKICAVGITASRWITMHGIAININCDLSNFDNIVPCGIADPNRGVCSLEQFNPNISMKEFQTTLLTCFSNEFNIKFIEKDEHELQRSLEKCPEIANCSLDRVQW